MPRTGGILPQMKAAARADSLLSSLGLQEILPEAWQQPVIKLVWLTALCGVAYLLKPFAGVLLTTFVMSFIASSFINNAIRLLKRIESTRQLATTEGTRRFLVLSFYAGFLAVVTIIVVGSVPRLIADSQYLLRISQSDDPYVYIANAVRNVLGDASTARLENFLLWAEGGAGAVTGASPLSTIWSDARSSRFTNLVASQLKGPVQAYLVAIVSATRQISQTIVSALLQGAVSLLFSFLVMWDLPTVSRGIRSLRQSRFAEQYKSLAPKVGSFAEIVGRSFEAQALIALVNTLLTTLGMLLLGLKGVVFLALFVLLCSFIPVAGFLMSTVPMAVVALVEYGLGKMLLVILMVAVVHLVEAYVANPQIYASLLELHPILCLSSLYVAEHFFGPRGMILAVPFAEYLVEEIIMDRSGKLARLAAESNGQPESAEAADFC